MTSELTALRRRVRQLEDELELARRLAPFSEPGPERNRIWRFIERESAHFPLAALCGACRVSRSTYYAWAKKSEGPTEADLEEAYLANTSRLESEDASERLSDVRIDALGPVYGVRPADRGRGECRSGQRRAGRDS